MKRRLLKFMENVLIIICLAIITISFLSLLQSTKDPDRMLTILGLRPAVIISGSMKPLLNPGDMTISKVLSPKDIKVGDVISYRVNGTIPNTHRVIEIINQDGQLMFETKGDANSSKDSGLVLSDRILGKLILKVPKVGYISEFLKTKLGFTLAIIIPLVIVIIFELFSMLYKPESECSKRREH